MRTLERGTDKSESTYQKILNKKLKSPRYREMRAETKNHYIQGIKFEVFVNKAFK